MGEPRIVARELCSPRGTTMKYTLRSSSSSPGGTLSVVESTYKHQSVSALRELQLMNRKQVTAVCAKNNLSYKRAMDHFVPGKRAEQLQAGREQKKQARAARKEQARVELALVAPQALALPV